jgi:hypothetical protein
MFTITHNSLIFLILEIKFRMANSEYTYNIVVSAGLWDVISLSKNIFFMKSSDSYTAEEDSLGSVCDYIEDEDLLN